MKPWKPPASAPAGALLLGRVRRGGERVLHRAEQPRLVERLDQEVEGAGAHRLHRAVDRAVGGDDDDPASPARRGAASRSSSSPSPSGSCRSSSTSRGRTRVAVRPRLGQAEGAGHLVAGAGQHRLVDHGQRRRVLDEQQAVRHRRSPQPAARRSRAKATAASISSMQRRTSAAMPSAGSAWAAALSARAQACSRVAPMRPGDRDQDVRGRADRPRGRPASSAPARSRCAPDRSATTLSSSSAIMSAPIACAERVVDRRSIDRPAPAGAASGVAGAAPAARARRHVRGQAAAERLDAGDRLGDQPVGPGRGDPVAVLAHGVGGQRDDRHLRAGVAAGADRADHVEAGQPRHLDVDHDQVDRLRLEALQRLDAVGADRDLGVQRPQHLRSRPSGWSDCPRRAARAGRRDRPAGRARRPAARVDGDRGGKAQHRLDAAGRAVAER